MSFTNTPVTRLVVLTLVAASITASLLDIKHYFYILIDVHIWRYRQLWRLLAYQLCYTNSTEVLFSAISFYNLRIIERMWGSRKYASGDEAYFLLIISIWKADRMTAPPPPTLQSFLIVSYLLTALLPPIIMIVLRPLTLGFFNYMPAGPTPIVFAALAQFHDMVPHMYKYRVATSAAPPSSEPFTGLSFSDKSFKYAIAVHLALLQWPGSVIGALVGWAVGQSWREGFLPVSLIDWRLPGWMIGLKTQRRSAEFEGLRRRLEDENESSATATGVQGQAGSEQAERRRTMGQQIADQFRQAL